MPVLDWSETETAHTPIIRPAFIGRHEPIDATGLGKIDRHGGRVSVDEKQMMNARADVNQLLPLSKSEASSCSQFRAAQRLRQFLD